MTPEERYRTDPRFHTLVCRIKDVLDGAQFTPDEVREAATLACTHSEAERRPQIVVDASLPPGVVEIRSAGLRYWMDVSSGGGA